MSRLRERIRRLGRQDAASMGFARAPSVRRSPALLLLARLDGRDVGPVERALEGGADGVIVAAGAPAGRAEGKDALWGVVLGAGPLPEGLERSGADFVIAGPDAPLEALGSEGLGVVVEVDEAWPDATVRALEMFAPDGLYVRLGDGVSIRRLLELRRLSALAAPLLLEVGAPPSREALPLLRDAGVAGIVVTAEALGALAALREQVNALPPRRRRRDEPTEAVLPRLEAPVASEEEFAPEDRAGSAGEGALTPT